ncbi:hypothetical protein MYU51_019443 [Penicillium brevicompactum]
MPPPQQPIQLIYCTTSVCIPKRKREHLRRRYTTRFQYNRGNSTTRHERKGHGLSPFLVPLLQPTQNTLGAAIATVKYTCWESYRRIGDKTKASPRRVVHRVFRPRPHRLHTMNGGVYEPLVVPIAKSYPIATVQFPVTDISPRPLGVRSCLVHPARLIRSDSWRVRRIGYNIMSTRHECERSANLMNSARHIPVARVECGASSLVCSSSSILMRSQAICPFLMTTGGMDDE